MTDPLLRAEPVLRAEDLSLDIDGHPILRQVSLTVAPAERVAVVGPSGSGKSSLLTLLAGVARPTKGQVTFRGQPLDGTARSKIAHIFQSYGLVSLLTAAENVEIALRASGRTPREARRLTADALSAVAMDPFADHLIEELSGGQQQRTAVALALARRPHVLLADEPTAEQDSGHRDLVLKKLLTETERGVALVIATHDTEVAERCDRTIRLAAGRLA